MTCTAGSPRWCSGRCDRSSDLRGVGRRRHRRGPARRAQLARDVAGRLAQSGEHRVGEAAARSPAARRRSRRSPRRRGPRPVRRSTTRPARLLVLEGDAASRATSASGFASSARSVSVSPVRLRSGAGEDRIGDVRVGRRGAPCPARRRAPGWSRRSRASAGCRRGAVVVDDDDLVEELDAESRTRSPVRRARSAVQRIARARTSRVSR